MPALAELNVEYADKDFQIIGIVIDTADKNFIRVQSALDRAKTVVAEAGSTYTHLIPSKSLKDFLSPVRSVPATVFVDGYGNQIGKTYVGARSKGAWATIIDSYLKYVASVN